MTVCCYNHVGLLPQLYCCVPNPRALPTPFRKLGLLTVSIPSTPCKHSIYLNIPNTLKANVARKTHAASINICLALNSFHLAPYLSWSNSNSSGNWVTQQVLRRQPNYITIWFVILTQIEMNF